MYFGAEGVLSGGGGWRQLIGLTLA
jgi:hypothetical protein